MKKGIKYLFLIALLLSFYTSVVKADEIDITKKGSIKINYQYNNEIIEGSKVSIYKVANYSDGKFSYLDNYHLSDSLDVETASQWSDLAIKISDYVNTNHIDELNSCEIKNNIECKFNNLDVGLYLITSTSVEKGGYQYTASPTLIAIPNYNEIDKYYIYDIDSFLKVGTKAINVDNNTAVVPKTIDNYYTYLVICIISFVIMVVVVFSIYILRKKDKGHEKN